MSKKRRSLHNNSLSIAVTVVPYSEEELAQALCNEWVPAEQLRQDQHFNFLREYLGPVRDGLHAQTMVLEWPYVSQSYLEDYTNYYAHCFSPYERDCTRVHFFGTSFTRRRLLAALPNATHKIWKSYLGYIVVKPLPTPLGATLLRPYANGSQAARRYPVQRPYHVSLLGKELTVPTLIWQQQDTNVSACATTALWMAFHKTAFLFQTRLPSPYRITESAGNLFNHSGRTFPNQGLDPFQIMTAIQSVGLVSELRNKFPDPRGLSLEVRLLKEKELKAFTYAYLRMGLPVLLFIHFDKLGEHLITATGYRAPEPQYAYAETVIPEGESAGRYPALYSDGIERFYAHDDGVGPYARLRFEVDTSLVITSWPENDDWKRAHLYTVVVPLVDAIRIRYEQVYGQIAVLNIWLQYLRQGYLGIDAATVWDIYLQYSNTHKEEVLQSRYGTPAQRQRVAVRLLPKYVWVARALQDGQPLLEFLFDATDLHNGFYCLLATTYAPLRDALIADLRMSESITHIILNKLHKSRYVDLLLNDVGLA